MSYKKQLANFEVWLENRNARIAATQKLYDFHVSVAEKNDLEPLTLEEWQLLHGDIPND